MMGVDAFLVSTGTTASRRTTLGTDTVAANVRLRWEYQPGNELFIVYQPLTSRFRTLIVA